MTLKSQQVQTNTRPVIQNGALNHQYVMETALRHFTIEISDPRRARYVADKRLTATEIVALIHAASSIFNRAVKLISSRRVAKVHAASWLINQVFEPCLLPLEANMPTLAGLELAYKPLRLKSTFSKGNISHELTYGRRDQSSPKSNVDDNAASRRESVASSLPPKPTDDAENGHS